MDTFKNLLNLLYTSPNNFSTVQMRWDEIRYKSHWQVLRQRWLEAHPPGSIVTMGYEDVPEVWRNRHALWWQRGERWRMDSLHYSGQYNRELFADNQQWYFRKMVDTETAANLSTIRLDTPTIKVHRREPSNSIINRNPSPLDATPVDPKMCLAMYDLTPVDETTYLGRRAMVVDAAYRRNWRCANLSKEAEWVHADRYRLLVDAERGFLLRHAALLDGEEAVVTEVTALRADAPLDDAIFALPPAAANHPTDD